MRGSKAAVASLLAVLCAGVKAAGPAQNYPTKPVRIVTGRGWNVSRYRDAAARPEA